MVFVFFGEKVDNTFGKIPGDSGYPLLRIEPRGVLYWFGDFFFGLAAT